MSALHALIRVDEAALPSLAFLLYRHVDEGYVGAASAAVTPVPPVASPPTATSPSAARAVASVEASPQHRRIGGVAPPAPYAPLGRRRCTSAGYRPAGPQTTALPSDDGFVDRWLEKLYQRHPQVLPEAPKNPATWDPSVVLPSHPRGRRPSANTSTRAEELRNAIVSERPYPPTAPEPLSRFVVRKRELRVA